MGHKSGNPYFEDKELHKVVYPEGVSPWGIRLSRAGSKYEDTTEFTDRGYPATRPYYPLLGKDLSHACMEGIIAKYPYPAKALFVTKGNYNYSSPGAKRVIEEAFRDKDKLPLLVTFDIVVGELSNLADYILADGTFLEQWATPHISPAMQSKASGVRQPVVDLLYPEIMLEEDWIIRLGKAADLPGLGRDALGPGVNLDTAAEWYRYSIANVAMEGDGVLPGAPEAEQINYVLARGGRFEDYEKAYKGDKLAHQRKARLNLYIEKLGSLKDSMTGDYFPGVGKFVPIADAKGNSIDDPGYPLHLITYKVAIHTMSRTIANPSLQQIWPENKVELYTKDAEALGIKDGDKVLVTSKTNDKGEVGTAKIREGIRPGVVAISHNYGHWQYGASSFDVDGEIVNGENRRSAGITANPIMRIDTSIGGVSVGDKAGGSSSFFDTKVRVKKL
jgi:anaerobic selenocysteine-containing dehydrogenase